MFKIEEVYNGINKFNIYNHSLSDEELDDVISKMLFEKKVLSYLFTASLEVDEENYVNMVRRFIPEEFFGKEAYILQKWDAYKENIKSLIESNHSFYSFFAEALMSYLHYKYLNQSLIIGVINVEETLTDQKTGTDACMYSDDVLVLGEAKFYKDFNSARDKIIEDFSSKSLINKVKGFYRAHNKILVHLKNINGITKTVPYEEFINYNIVLSGFILHNQKTPYEYKKIDEITKVEGLKKYDVVFYHLPIPSKEELIYKIIKRALEVIANETK